MPEETTPGQPVDRERYNASVSRLGEIFRDISETATEVSKSRCPYKNVQNRCTAGFGCRNQLRDEDPSELLLCTGSDNLDYRGAWDV